MDLKTILFRVEERIATITLNRPHRLNAWTGRMHTEYRWALQQAETDERVRAIVVTGNGRGFCAGADSSALEGHVGKGGYDPGIDRHEIATPGFGVRPEFDHDYAFHFGLTKPVLAAINGPAAGVGLVLACFCDIRFAAAGVKLTTAHGRLNLPAEYGLSWILPRIVGLGRANDLLLSSRVVLAEEAEHLGLVNKVLPADELLPYTYDYARSLLQISRASLAESKRQIYVDLHRDVGSSVEEAAALLDRMMKEPDFAEGVSALNEKRPPEFR